MRPATIIVVAPWDADRSDPTCGKRVFQANQSYAIRRNRRETTRLYALEAGSICQTEQRGYDCCLCRAMPQRRAGGEIETGYSHRWTNYEIRYWRLACACVAQAWDRCGAASMS